MKANEVVLLVLAVFLICSAGAALAATNLVVNGSFELADPAVYRQVCQRSEQEKEKRSADQSGFQSDPDGRAETEVFVG